MLFLCTLLAKQKGIRPLIAAGRNAHKAFMSGAALLDVDVEWIYPRDSEEGVLSCNISSDELANWLDEREEKKMLKNYSLSSVSKYLGKLKRAEKLADYGVKNKWEDNGIVYIFFADYNDVVRGYLRVSNGQAVNLANGNQVEVVDYISKYETGTYIWFTLK